MRVFLRQSLGRRFFASVTCLAGVYATNATINSLVENQSQSFTLVAATKSELEWARVEHSIDALIRSGTSDTPGESECWLCFDNILSRRPHLTADKGVNMRKPTEHAPVRRWQHAIFV